MKNKICVDELNRLLSFILDKEVIIDPKYKELRIVPINQSGAGDSAGHSITLGVTGGGNNIKVLQSGVKDNKVDMTMQGDGGDVNISQTD